MTTRVASRAEEQTHEKPSTKAKGRGWLVFVLGQGVIFVTLVLLIEMGLSIAGIQTEGNEQPSPTYPASPDDFYKVAIFGGSSAEGTYCPLGFESFLEYELRRRYPNRKFHIQNYARHGEPFHRHQAEYAKRLVDKYDLMLVYCGNNEAENWYDDSGYWRKPKFKANRDLVYHPPADATQWPALQSRINWLRDHSRINAMAGRIRQSFAPSVEKNLNYDYDEFESQRSVPDAELQAIVDNFESDIRELSALAQSSGTEILLAPGTTYGGWPPSYSVLSGDLDDDAKLQWREHYERGLELLDQPRRAIDEFTKAAAIDDSVAILNYRMGMAWRALNEHAKSQQLLTKAIDQEGHYFRTHSSLHERAAKLATQLENAHFTDLRQGNQRLIEVGVSEDDLFTDICHPSFLGYAVIANQLADVIGQLPEWQQVEVDGQFPVDQFAGTDSATVWKQYAEELHNEFGITKNELHRSLAENILYCFDLAHFTAYPERCELQINRMMSEMETSERDDTSVAFNAVSRARLAVGKGDRITAAEYLNVALEVSPDLVETVLDMKAWNHLIGEEFEDAGVVYSSGEGQFIVEPQAGDATMDSAESAG